VAAEVARPNAVRSRTTASAELAGPEKLVAYSTPENCPLRVWVHLYLKSAPIALSEFTAVVPAETPGGAREGGAAVE
jgi:hypothetical protein